MKIAAWIAALALAVQPAAGMAQVPNTFATQSGNVPASELDANFTYLNNLANKAPVNLAPNSQWEIWSGVGYGTAVPPSGVGYESTIAASGNTVKTDATFTGSITNANPGVLTASAVTGTLAIGQTVTSATSNDGGSPPAGIPQVAINTTIASGAGPYTLNNQQTAVSSQAMYACAVGVGTSYVTNCGYTTFTVSSTGDLSVGDLVTVSGAGVDSSLTAAPMRVTAIPDSTHITVRVPRGQSPSVSAAATITPIQIGANWYASNGTGSGPDGWGRFPTTAGAGPILWRDFLQGNYNVNKPSNVAPYAALGVRLQQASNTFLKITVPGQLPSAQLPNYLGKTLVFGAYVMQKVQGGTGTWGVLWNVDSGATNCTSAPANPGVWQWMECSFTVPNTSTFLEVGIQFQGNVGDVYYVADPVLAVGSYIGGVQNYQKPKGQLFQPFVHLAVNYWINQTITFPANQQVYDESGDYAFGFTFDPYADTGGKVAPTVLKATGFIEGYDAGTVATGTGYVRLMAFADCTPNAGHQGVFMAQHVASVKEFTGGDYPFLQSAPASAAWQGTMCVSTNLASDQWKQVSIEFDDFILQ